MIAFNIFKIKTMILEINNRMLLFIKLSCAKTSMQIINTIYYVNLSC